MSLKLRVLSALMLIVAGNIGLLGFLIMGMQNLDAFPAWYPAVMAGVAFVWGHLMTQLAVDLVSSPALRSRSKT